MQQDPKVAKIILKYDGKKDRRELSVDKNEMEEFLERLYQDELARAPEELKPTVHKKSIQEFVDELNREEYNCWHKFDRHRSGHVKNTCTVDEATTFINPIELLGVDGGISNAEKEIDTELFKRRMYASMPAKQADLLWLVCAEGVPVADIAQQEGVSMRAIYLRLETAKKNFAKIVTDPSQI